MVFSILTRAGDSASIPCLATDPGVVNLSLEPCHGGALPTGLHYVASLERGMVIFDTQKAFEGCYICTGRLGSTHVKSHHYDLIVRPGKITLFVCVLGCEVQYPDLLFDIQNFLSQSQTRPLWLRCGNPRGWSWHGARLLPWPAAPPTSTETSSWSGPHRPARWEPFALSLRGWPGKLEGYHGQISNKLTEREIEIGILLEKLKRYMSNSGIWSYNKSSQNNVCKI